MKSKLRTTIKQQRNRIKPVRRRRKWSTKRKVILATLHMILRLSPSNARLLVTKEAKRKTAGNGVLNGKKNMNITRITKRRISFRSILR